MGVIMDDFASFFFIVALIDSSSLQREVRLEPERLSLTEWKRIRLGGATQLCNENGSCGPYPTDPCCICAGKGTCVSCCHPGRFCSPGGICGSFVKCDIRDVCAQCQGAGCSLCCAPDTGATGIQKGWKKYTTQYATYSFYVGVLSCP